MFIFNCEPGRIKHDALKDTNFEEDRPTGNSNITAKTGSTYISESMTDIIKIPTANPRYFGELEECLWAILVMADNRKWPPKPEIVTTMKLRRTILKFQRQRRVRKKCGHSIGTATDNRIARSAAPIGGWRRHKDDKIAKL